jgi:hypothetical protein
MSVSSLLHIIAPQYDLTDHRNDFITMASSQVNRTWFGANYELAVANLAAHLITIYTNSSYISGSGVITGKSEGDLSISYSAPSMTGGGNDSLNQTGFGREFLRLSDQGGFIMDVTGRSPEVVE